MDLKVKDFAAQQGVSESIIYRHIRQNQEQLGDSVIRKPKATWLTDEAQEFLRGLMVQSPPPAVIDTQSLDELLESRAEIDRLRKKLEAAQDAFAEILVENKELQIDRARLEAAETQRKLLEESRDDYKTQAAEARREAREVRREADKLHLGLEKEKSARAAAQKRERILREYTEACREYNALPRWRRFIVSPPVAPDLQELEQMSVLSDLSEE